MPDPDYVNNGPLNGSNDATFGRSQSPIMAHTVLLGNERAVPPIDEPGNIGDMIRLRARKAAGELSQRYADGFSRALTDIFRSPVSVRVERITAVDDLSAVPWAPGVTADILSDQGAATVSLRIETGLLLMLLDRLIGGAGAPIPTEGWSVSEVELALTRELVHKMCACTDLAGNAADVRVTMREPDISGADGAIICELVFLCLPTSGTMRVVLASSPALTDTPVPTVAATSLQVATAVVTAGQLATLTRGTVLKIEPIFPEIGAVRAMRGDDEVWRGRMIVGDDGGLMAHIEAVRARPAAKRNGGTAP